MMKLNLGCGQDRRDGYINVDFVQPCDQLVDLSEMPWPWKDGSAEEIMMLDFLEHFPYRDTLKILQECWRVLEPGGRLIVQVPDFDHCARAVLNDDGVDWQCNRCGNWRSGKDGPCSKCGQSLADTQDAAIHRLYGGQNVKGNWHYTAFSEGVLARLLEKSGFICIDSLEIEHQQANWNFKVSAVKGDIPWEEQ